MTQRGMISTTGRLGRALALLVTVALCSPVLAEITGDSLAREIYERADGRDSVTAGRMTLKGKSSRERVRETVTYRREDESDASRALVRFTAPANIADTGLLVHNHTDGNTDQWLYLPAAKQVRRVSSDNRGGSFVQSDLYFEDLQERRPDEDVHTYLGLDDSSGQPLHKLESVPRDAANSAYSRRVSWVHPPTLIPVRIDFYEGGDAPSKRLEVLSIENVQGYWTVMASRMTTLRSGHETLMEVDSVRYDQGLPEDLFSVRALSDTVFERAFRN